MGASRRGWRYRRMHASGHSCPIFPDSTSRPQGPPQPRSGRSSSRRPSSRTPTCPRAAARRSGSSARISRPCAPTRSAARSMPCASLSTRSPSCGISSVPRPETMPRAWPYACKHFGTRGVIFMPVTTPQQKIGKTQAFGAGQVEIRLIGDYFDETLRAAMDFCAAEGARFLPPFDDPDIIEGQATCALEILAQMPGGRPARHADPARWGRRALLGQHRRLSPARTSNRHPLRRTRRGAEPAHGPREGPSGASRPRWTTS